MCGIICYYGNFNHEEFKKSIEILSHRGPDDKGYYINSQYNLGLGHTRLSIIDTSEKGKQPMYSNNGKFVIVFNGEIYNYLNLKKDLEKKGYIFNNNTDTEVLLNLFQDKKYEMLEHIEGIFSFVIYDIEENTSFIARDSFGVKPLYIYKCSKGLALSSELKALIKLSPENLEINYNSLYRYTSFLWCPGEGTPIKNISKIDPGTAIIINNNKIKEMWQWFTNPHYSATASDSLNKEEAIMKLRLALEKSVQNQLVSDVPLGGFLSGGLDSTSILHYAKKHSSSYDCFTIDTSEFDEPGVENDLRYARIAAQHFDVKLNEVKIGSNQVLDDFEKIIIGLDEPLADLSAMNVLYMSNIAKKMGIKVLLSGTGGDDIFTGYRRHLALRYYKYLNHIPNSILDFLTHQIQKYSDRGVFMRKFNKFFETRSSDDDQTLMNSFLWNKSEDIHEIFSDNVKNQVGLSSNFEPFKNYLNLLPSHFSMIDKLLSLDQRFFLTDHNLNYTDKMSMQAGIEVRVPFLDKELVELASKIPMKQKQGFFSGKIILKNAMKKYLPREIINRKKTGFGLPIRSWMKKELHPLIDQYLSISKVNNRGIFNSKKVSELIKNNNEGKIDGSYLILSLLSIEVWCKNYLD